MPALIQTDVSSPKDIPLNHVKRFASTALRILGLSDAELGILLVDDKRILEINREWLGRNYPTNVISFSQEYQVGVDAAGKVLGDIVISVDTARKEAKHSGRTLHARLDELVVHGLLHILGFDHERGEGEAKRMEQEERKLLKEIYEEKIMADLCINVDHVATVRQARGTVEPDPVWAASIVELAGADGVVVHLREDRRHIQDRDVRILRETVRSRLTLEMAATDEMIKIASEIKPDIVTLVPEKRQELTTEGGLDVMRLEAEIKDAVARLHDASIPVSLFIDPEREQIEAAARTGAECIEIHTGRYADAQSAEEEDREFESIVESSRLARDLGLRVHAGHGLNYTNVPRLSALPEIEEFSIGHAVIARAIFVGLEKAVRDMNALVKKGFID